MGPCGIEDAFIGEIQMNNFTKVVCVLAVIVSICLAVATFCTF